MNPPNDSGKKGLDGFLPKKGSVFQREVSYVAKTMYNPKLYKEMTGINLPEFKKIEHRTTNFIDNSTNVVGACLKSQALYETGEVKQRS